MSSGDATGVLLTIRGIDQTMRRVIAHYLLAGAMLTMPAFLETAMADMSEPSALLPPGAKAEQVAGGYGFLEGPVWMPDASLIFSDIKTGVMYRYTPGGTLGGGGPVVFRKPSGMANGNTSDLQGRLVTCDQNRRAVTRTEADSSIIVLADRFQGNRFNSPNDVIVKSDGSIWFSDPPYGVPKGEHRELDHQWAYRIDPTSHAVTAVVTDLKMPNGLCFSPDETRLYVADSDTYRHDIHVYDVTPDGRAINGRVFATIHPGVPDGMRVDAEGRVWTSAGDGVQVFDPDGHRVAAVAVPETPSNVCFAASGKGGSVLYITARKSLYAVKTKVRPVTRPALRAAE